MTCETCIHASEILALQEDMKRNSEQHKEFYANFTSSAVASGKRDTIQDQILQTLERLESKVDKLESKPAKRYDTFVTAIITAVASSAITYMVALYLK